MTYNVFGGTLNPTQSIKHVTALVIYLYNLHFVRTSVTRPTVCMSSLGVLRVPAPPVAVSASAKPQQREFVVFSITSDAPALTELKLKLLAVVK